MICFVVFSSEGGGVFYSRQLSAVRFVNDLRSPSAENECRPDGLFLVGFTGHLTSNLIPDHITICLPSGKSYSDMMSTSGQLYSSILNSFIDN